MGIIGGKGRSGVPFSVRRFGKEKSIRTKNCSVEFFHLLLVRLLLASGSYVLPLCQNDKPLAGEFVIVR